MIDSLHFGFGHRRVPLVLQTEAAECGLACLAMLASALGRATDLPALRRRFAVSMKGCTAADLVRMAGDLGLQARALRAELEHLPQLRLPCVLHWDLNHFVVLTAVGRRHVVLHDPAHGRRRMAMVEVSRHFTGVAIELSPLPAFQRGDERQRVSLRGLIGPVRGLRRALAQVFVLALVLELFALLAPFFLQSVVDGVLVSADRELLITLGLGFGLLLLCEAATAALRGAAVLVVSGSLNLQWLGNVFAHLLRLPMAWFERRHQGDVMSRFGAVRHIQEALTTSFVEAVLDGLLVVATLAMMLVYSPTLSAIAAAGIGSYGLLRLALFGRQRDANAELLIHDAKSASHFLESLRGMQALKLYGRETDRHARFLNLAVETMNADLARRRLDLVFSVGRRLLFGLQRIAVVWVGASMVLGGRGFSVGMLFAFIAYQEQFATRLGALFEKAVEWRMLRLHGERLADIVMTAPEAPGQGTAWPSTLEAAALTASPRIELRDVRFRYADGEPPVLDGCSLVIEPGEAVAIVGASGSGKTTLVKLLLGMHEPQAGEILIDGQPLARLGLARWRAQLGTVMQDDVLFAGSIADNIAFFDPQATPEAIERSARLASVHDDILAMPMGYETLVGDMGTSLSGGQKQRLLLARALYARPRVLVLDEATSALDVERERVVNQAIRQLGITRVIVAHRPETIASANRVIVLQQGRASSGLRSVSSGPDPAAA